MDSLSAWLQEYGLERYAPVFAENGVDLNSMRLLTDGDLKELGVLLGHRRTLLKAITELKGNEAAAPIAQGIQERPPARPSVSAEAERRQLTVMFCDLVGSTALSEALDAEDLRGVLQAYQQVAGAVIERYAGHVAQYLGDGLMIYFGWPAAHEDDAHRAVMAGLEIVEAVTALALVVPLHVRIGVASGSVVVGDTGDGDASVPKFAVGETPNVAARMQGLAGQDEIVIAASTRQLVGAAFELVDLGAHALKGFSEAVRMWRVIGVAATEGRFEASHGGRLTPFVGREPELASLLGWWRHACAGEGWVVLVSGEPGIGKSRVTQVLSERIASKPHRRLHYQCSPYHTSSALHPVVEHIKRAAGLERSEDTPTSVDKMDRWLRTGLSDTSVVGPLFAALLSIDPSDCYAPSNLTPQAQKAATLKALVDLVLALAAKQPVLMIFEDAHWIDPTTQETLDLLLPSIAGHRILAVITHRPEYQPPWLGLAHVAALPLGRLPRKEAVLMAAELSGRKPLPAEVLDQIVIKTEGVPLFVEELTKTVLESGVVTEGEDAYHLARPLPDLAIPSTLQDSLMARLDRAADMREIARIGACIGRRFSHELLAAVSPLTGAALDDALRQLEEAELVFRGTEPDTSYTFKHALVRDAAYNSLLRASRRAIHGRIAETLQRNFADIVESAPETLAYHYTEGAVFNEAARYWRLAAERASARFANAEAIAHAHKGLAVLAGMPQTSVRLDLELALRMTLIASLRMTDRYDEALDELRRAEAFATEHQQLLALSRIHTMRGNIYFPLGQVERCFAEHQAAWQFARQAGSIEDEARTLGGLGDAYYLGGRYLTAHQQFDRCVVLCHAHALEAIEIAYLPMRAATHMYGLRFEQSLDDCRSAIDLVAKLGEARGAILSRDVSSRVLLHRHDFAQAEVNARAGLEAANRLGARRFVPVFNDILSRIAMHDGDRTGALELLERAWAICRETGITLFGPLVLGGMAVVGNDLGARREALREGEALLDRGCVSHNYFWFYRDAIEVSLDEADWEGTQRYVRALEDYFRIEPSPWLELIVARARALAEFGRGGPREAVLAEMQRLRDEAVLLGIRAELPRLEAALKTARVI